MYEGGVYAVVTLSIFSIARRNLPNDVWSFVGAKRSSARRCTVNGALKCQ